MIKVSSLAALLCSAAIVFHSLSGVAQDEPPVTNPDAADTTTSAEPAAEPTPTDAQDSPFDYRSSEEISEDNSVSFPVDI